MRVICQPHWGIEWYAFSNQTITLRSKHSPNIVTVRGYKSQCSCVKWFKVDLEHWYEKPSTKNIARHKFHTPTTVTSNELRRGRLQYEQYWPFFFSSAMGTEELVPVSRLPIVRALPKRSMLRLSASNHYFVVTSTIAQEACNIQIHTVISYCLNVPYKLITSKLIFVV